MPPTWLFGIELNRCKPEIREVLMYIIVDIASALGIRNIIGVLSGLNNLRKQDASLSYKACRSV